PWAKRSASPAPLVRRRTWCDQSGDVRAAAQGKRPVLFPGWLGTVAVAQVQHAVTRLHHGVEPFGLDRPALVLEDSLGDPEVHAAHHLSPLFGELREGAPAQVHLELVDLDLRTEAELVEVELEGRELAKAVLPRFGRRRARCECLCCPARPGAPRLGRWRLERRSVARAEQANEVLAELRVEAAVPRRLGRPVEHAGPPA